MQKSNDTHATRLPQIIVRTMLLMTALTGGWTANAQSYRKLHDKAIVVDTHNDVLTTATLKGMDIGTNLTGKTHSDLERFRKGGVDVQVFSIFCDDHYGVGSAYREANREIDSLYAIARRKRDKMEIVTDAAGLEQGGKQHKQPDRMGRG